MFKKKIFVSKKLKQEIICQEHNSLLKEYQGIIKIYKRIQKTFFFFYIRQQVISHIIKYIY